MATTDPLPALDPADPILKRLIDQQSWYSKNSRAAKTAFKRIKVAEIVAAAIIPFLTGHTTVPGVNYLIGALGVLITILEGVLHLNQYQENWTSYRRMSEALKHEQYLFLAKAGPYQGAADPRALLAERVEGSITQENDQWVQTAGKAGQDGVRKPSPTP